MMAASQTSQQDDESTVECRCCHTAIPNSRVDAITRRAYCHVCATNVEVLGLLRDLNPCAGVDFGHPPEDVHYRDAAGEIVVVATHHSLVGALGALLSRPHWEGVLCLLGSAAMLAAWHRLGYPLPAWFATPRGDGQGGGFATTFLLVALFVFGAALLLRVLRVLLRVFQRRTEIRVRQGQAVVLTGSGWLDDHQYFATSAVVGVRIDDDLQDLGDTSHREAYIAIELCDGPPVSFGWELSREQRTFMTAAVQRAVAEQPPGTSRDHGK